MSKRSLYLIQLADRANHYAEAQMILYAADKQSAAEKGLARIVADLVDDTTTVHDVAALRRRLRVFRATYAYRAVSLADWQQLPADRSERAVELAQIQTTVIYACDLRTARKKAADSDMRIIDNGTLNVWIPRTGFRPARID